MDSVCFLRFTSVSDSHCHEDQPFKIQRTQVGPARLDPVGVELINRETCYYMNKQMRELNVEHDGLAINTINCINMLVIVSQYQS